MFSVKILNNESIIGFRTANNQIKNRIIKKMAPIVKQCIPNFDITWSERSRMAYNLILYF